MGDTALGGGEVDDYAGRILAGRYRLPVPPSDDQELVETRAFDTRSGQEVLVRQVPLPEVVDAELLDGHRAPEVVSPGDLPAVRRAIEAAQAAARIPDHPRLDQVFDVFAEGGSLWIVSELVPARPLAALVADQPLSPYRAAEVASDVLTALRVLHAHGWTHRNITVRTVLVCDDGRVVLTGLAAGAAEEALCGYDPVPASAGWGSAAAYGDPDPTTAAYDAPAYGSGYGAPAYGTPVPGDPGRGAPDHADYDAPPAFGSGDGGSGHSDPASDGPGRRGSGYSEPTSDGPGRGGSGYDGPADGAPGTGDPGHRDDAGSPRPRGNTGAGYAPLVAPGYDTAPLPRQVTGPLYADQIVPQREPDPAPGRPEPRPRPLPEGAGSPPDPDPGPAAGPRPENGGPARPDQRAARSGGAIAAYRAGAQAAARRELRPEPRPEGSNLPQGYSYPYGGAPDETPPPLPAVPSGPRAPLALPQGYQQADPDPAPDPAPAPLPASAPAPAAVPLPAPAPVPLPPRGGWDAEGPRARTGPATALAAERARQTRMAVVGPVTERWAPEQAGPVHGNWQLAAPVGPATDLWALGALLYRAVQGHAPYPEDSTAELVEMVCAEPPAFAEECGPLRPVVESLLRQDPTERPDFEELRGWLRSLVRSAPEPEGATDVIALPAPDPARLPVVRRRADLSHGRHRGAPQPRRRGPRALGRTLLVSILLALAGAVAYAMVFMPKADRADPVADRGPAPVRTTPQPSQPSPPAPAGGPGGTGGTSGTGGTPSAAPESKPAPQTAPPGFITSQDPEGFQIVVPEGWERRPINDMGQVRYSNGDHHLIVVPGRDAVEGKPDPAAYQKDKQRELEPFRSSTWVTSRGIRTTTVGQQLIAEGQYTWIDGGGRSVYARNYVVALGGRYHVVMVTGPQDGESKVTEVFEKATGSYRPGR
ncbi:serine/threonine protein kinase [Streptomyces sp. NPDC090022]|uniref:serine/threonine protein kinase n=1 Tax=Streptomyces sp. NPDC090022 TaxID=3365920 RepID=UPI003800891A